MARYRVSFFKNLLSSDGHQFKCLQQQVDVTNSEGVAPAMESASRQFERCHGLQHWQQLADSIEIETADCG
jgi:hypothetical protein